MIWRGFILAEEREQKYLGPHVDYQEFYSSSSIWHMECGHRDKRLIKRAIKTLAAIAKKTKQINLITDGEKRYGTTLFEESSAKDLMSQFV
ncbi:MAG: hypothetical protein KA436_07375 [Oligoflexales bacterium]|nr:hypothetical protein [Oligoflexales bacterium]